MGECRAAPGAPESQRPGKATPFSCPAVQPQFLQGRDGPRRARQETARGRCGEGACSTSQGAPRPCQQERVEAATSTAAPRLARVAMHRGPVRGGRARTRQAPRTPYPPTPSTRRPTSAPAPHRRLPAASSASASAEGPLYPARAPHAMLARQEGSEAVRRAAAAAAAAETRPPGQPNRPGPRPSSSRPRQVPQGRGEPPRGRRRRRQSARGRSSSGGGRRARCRTASRCRPTCAARRPAAAPSFAARTRGTSAWSTSRGTSRAATAATCARRTRGRHADGVEPRARTSRSSCMAAPGGGWALAGRAVGRAGPRTSPEEDAGGGEMDAEGEEEV